MPQRKKEGIRDAILEASYRLFRDHGYNETSIPTIAREAGVSTANIYVYFESKLAILFAVYEPWLQERLERLERSVRRIKTPERRIERLLLVVWRELPREANGFANNVVQALSTAGRGGSYSPHLRQLFQKRIAHWLGDCLGLDDDASLRIAGIVLMAFDGFALNVHLGHGLICDAKTVRLFCEVICPTAGQQALPRRREPG